MTNIVAFLALEITSPSGLWAPNPSRRIPTPGGQNIAAEQRTFDQA
ncbi:MAG: hypothetical protein IT445_10960 [Phycisphaeraceae bacterium]|nr:hypothetical protein [Phycisphaeraceae bacterium]